jgi:hypothetical protein
MGILVTPERLFDAREKFKIFIIHSSFAAEDGKTQGDVHPNSNAEELYIYCVQDKY